MSPAMPAHELSIHPGSIQINVRGAFIVDDVLYEDENSIPETSDIALPFQSGDISHIAVDIGGSLAKIVYFTTNASVNSSAEDLGPQIHKRLASSSSLSEEEFSDDEAIHSGGRLNFYKIETERIDEFIQFIAKLIKFYQRKPHIMATGGGSVKFYDRLKQELDVDVTREDEMDCLIEGLDFFITEIPNEVFMYTEQNPMQFVNQADKKVDESIYPYLLVNIGSGVSMIKVTGPNNFERVGGSSLGGGTLWGLLSLLTDASSYDEMLANAAEGDNTEVDMLVGDIYGTDYNKIGLKSTTIASSFGKVFNKKYGINSTEKNAHFQAQDVSRSLLYAISNNIGQIAYLQAKSHDLQHIYFGGSYIRGHPQTMNTLSYAINFWSKGSKRAYFLRHEGYLGAVGAFVKRQPTGWGRANALNGKKV